MTFYSRKTRPIFLASLFRTATLCTLAFSLASYGGLLVQPLVPPSPGILNFAHANITLPQGNVILNEDFELGTLDPRGTISTIGTFNSAPGIKTIPNFGSTKAFGFGRSTCGASCFLAHVTKLRITLPAPTFISNISFKEMELFSNWGSQGYLVIDGVRLTSDPLGDFGKYVNDFQPDTTFRSKSFAVNRSATIIELRVEDITNLSEIYIDDLVMTGSQGSMCFPNLPTPQLVLTGTEDYIDAFGTPFTRYNLCVNNWSAFPAELFEAAPDLPACGLNPNASRTVVNIFGDGQAIYGFCALGTPQDLTQIWFGRLRGQAPPASVYITLTDRRCGIVYRSNTISTAQFCVPHPPDLVSWWPGDGNANDIGDNNHGTLQNGATFAPGLVGQAFSFDGVDDVVSIPNTPNLNFSSSSSFTIELWAFRTSAATVMHLVGKRAGCGGGPFYQMAIGPGAFPSEAFPLNVWTHAAVTYDGNTGLQRQYINGAVIVTSDASSFIGPNTAPLLIGNSGTCTPFGGLIDEVSLYNRALSSSEIQAIYNAGSAGKCNCKVATGADLAITKTASPNPVLTGSNLTYTITVANKGAGAATNVTVTDDLPATTTFVSCAAMGGGICSGSGNNRTVTFTSLAAGASATITLIANVNCSLANGTAISNMASVSSATPDSNPNNNAATANVTTSNPPPVITGASANPSVLWPPNHKMVDVMVNYNVTDNCGSPSCTLSVSSNEPIDGTGDGDTAPDWEIVDVHRLRLRAERAGSGNGRIYTITITCTDSAGISSRQTVTVQVPRSYQSSRRNPTTRRMG